MDRLDRACHLPDARGQRAVHLPAWAARPPAASPTRRPGLDGPPDWEAACDRGAVPGAGRDRPLALACRLRLLPGGMDVALQHAPRGGAWRACGYDRRPRLAGQSGAVPRLGRVCRKSRRPSTQVQVVFTQALEREVLLELIREVHQHGLVDPIGEGLLPRWRIGGIAGLVMSMYLMCEVTSRQFAAATAAARSSARLKTTNAFTARDLTSSLSLSLASADLQIRGCPCGEWLPAVALVLGPLTATATSQEYPSIRS